MVTGIATLGIPDDGAAGGSADYRRRPALGRALEVFGGGPQARLILGYRG